MVAPWEVWWAVAAAFAAHLLAAQAMEAEWLAWEAAAPVRVPMVLVTQAVAPVVVAAKVVAEVAMVVTVEERSVGVHLAGATLGEAPKAAHTAVVVAAVAHVTGGGARGAGRLATGVAWKVLVS